MSRIRQLRNEYKEMPILQFVRIVDKYSHNPEAMVNSLIEAELAALASGASVTAMDREINERLRKLHQELPHHDLDLSVPEGIDLEHAQCIVVYGVTSMGRTAVFAKQRISDVKIKINVRNKLGLRFSSKTFEAALDFLVRERVLVLGGRSTEPNVALNLNDKDATPLGAHNIQVIKRYLHLR